MDILTNIVKVINEYLWNYGLLFLLCGTGLYFTIRLKFIQVRKFGRGFKMAFGGLFKKNKDKADAGGMTSFQSLATAIAAQVGTGNLVGATGALIAGGPGAIFWMWVSAFLGMATIYVEATLAQKFKSTKDGVVVGGPRYYIMAAFKGKFGKVLAAIFSILIVLALGFMGDMVQSNAIGNAFESAFNIPAWTMGIAVAAIAVVIFIGGVKRIASVTEKLVPFMALLYIVGALIVIFANVTKIPGAFGQIFVGAFNPQAVTGGVIGITIQKAMRFGVARGLFSNEAGMGSTPHARALAKVKHPCDQGFIAMMGVFIDTFIILTLTVVVVLVTDVLPMGYSGVLNDSNLTQAAFSSFFGSFGNIFIAICMFFFAFSTIIGWYFFGASNVSALFGKIDVRIYAVIVCGFLVVGSFLKVDLVWALTDMFNGLMVIPNLIALLALSGFVIKLNKDYESSNRLKTAQRKKKKHRKKRPNFWDVFYFSNCS